MKSLRRSYDKKRSTIRWMKQTQLQLKLSPVKTKAIQTWTCVHLLLQWGTHSGVNAESAASRGIEDRTASVVLIYVERVEKVHSGSNDCTLIYNCRGRLATVCTHFPSVTCSGRRWETFWTRPSPATSEWKSFGFRHLRFFAPSMDRSFTIVCIFFYKFSQFWAAIEVAEQPPNKRRRNSSFLVNRWKLTPSFRCLSYLQQPKAQRETVFSVAVQLGWLCHARNPLDRRAVQKPWNCQLAGRQKRRVDVFYQNLPHVRNSESRFTSTCLPRSRFLCDQRPTSASRKLEICATRATNKVHIDEQPVGE